MSIEVNSLPDNVINDPFIFFNHPYPISIENNSKLICQYHIGEKLISDNPTDILSFLFFNIKILKLDILIKVIERGILKKEIKYQTTNEEYVFLESSFKYSDFKDNNINIEIFLNDVNIKQEYISKLKENCKITKI